MACPPGTVAAYLRVSSQVQRRRETIASQHEAVLDHARRRGRPPSCSAPPPSFPARKTAHLRRKASAAPPAVQAIAWAAQKRLCARYWHLYHAGKVKCVVTTAVACELVGFLWAIACEVMGRPHATRAVS